MIWRQESKPIYGLSTGEYDDYQVLCLCPTKKDATALAKRYNEDLSNFHSEVRVEAFPYHSANVDKIEILILSMNLGDDGTEIPLKDYAYNCWPFDTLTPQYMCPVYWRWIRAPIHNGTGGRLEAGGWDHELVRSVFEEKRLLIHEDPKFRKRKEAHS